MIVYRTLNISTGIDTIPEWQIGRLALPFGDVNIGLFVLIPQQRVKERVDQIAVANLLGHSKQSQQKLIQFQTSPFSHNFDRTSTQMDALRETGQSIRYLNINQFFNIVELIIVSELGVPVGRGSRAFAETRRIRGSCGRGTFSHSASRAGSGRCRRSTFQDRTVSGTL